MKAGKLVSVIVPVYKVEPYLDRCVQSIVDQSYQEIEIILVDDGSPDNCPAMCDAWAEEDKRVRAIHKPNGGLSDARNAGMAAARGEFVSFVDSDDWLAPAMLERLVEAMERDDSDIAACAIELVWSDGSPSSLLTVQKNCVLNRQEAQKALLRENLLKQPACAKLYRRETIESIPFELGKLHEDVFWSYQAVGNARRVSLIDYIGYYYYQHSDSIMGEGYTRKRLDALEAVERRYRYLAESFPDLEREARIGIFNSCIYHGQMALKHLPAGEREKAFAVLNRVINNYPLRRKEYLDRKLSHRLWLDLTRISLQTACWIKNVLNVGL